jgi:Calcium binding
MLVQIHWQGREVAIPLSQLDAIGADESTQEAIGDYHYWFAQGCILWLCAGIRQPARKASFLKEVPVG